MKIIISPAKKMRNEVIGFDYDTLPIYLDKSLSLLDYLKDLNINELNKVLKTSDKILNHTYNLYQNISLKDNLYPALFMYDGLVFKYIASDVLNDDELNYLNNHLLILSGLYGVLRCNDGINPYRLEMQSKINYNNCDNLYDYWDDLIYQFIKDENYIINLASKEYSILIEKYYDPNKIINIVFGSIINNKLIIKGTNAKMARGAMVRYMASKQINDLNQLKEFNELGFIYHEELSDFNNLVFIK